MRISVSDLDSYRYYKATEDMTLEEIISRLRHETQPTIAMRAGRAFHSILENSTKDYLLKEEQDGFTFKFEFDAEVALPVIREMKGEVQMQTPSGPVTLVGIVDGIDHAIYDHKLTSRFEAERYTDSMQWRSYLTMFNASKFVYNVFEARENGWEWTIYGFHQFPLYAYPGMAEDVQEAVSELAQFITEHREAIYG